MSRRNRATHHINIAVNINKKSLLSLRKYTRRLCRLVLLDNPYYSEQFCTDVYLSVKSSTSSGVERAWPIFDEIWQLGRA